MMDSNLLWLTKPEKKKVEEYNKEIEKKKIIIISNRFIANKKNFPLLFYISACINLLDYLHLFNLTERGWNNSKRESCGYFFVQFNRNEPATMY